MVKRVRRNRGNARASVAFVAAALAFVFFVGTLARRGVRDRAPLVPVVEQPVRVPKQALQNRLKEVESAPLAFKTESPADRSDLISNVYTPEVCATRLGSFLRSYDTGGKRREEFDCFAGYREGDRLSPGLAKKLRNRRLQSFEYASKLTWRCSLHLAQPLNALREFSEQEASLLSNLQRVQGATKRSLFCHEVAMECERRVEGSADEGGGLIGQWSRGLVERNVADHFAKGADFLVLGSAARGEANAFSDLDLAVLLPDGRASDAERMEAASFFASVHERGAAEETRAGSRAWCYPSNIGTFLSPGSFEFVGTPRDVARMHEAVNSHTAEGRSTLRGIWQRAKPEQLARVRGEDMLRATTAKMMVVLANLYLATPWADSGEGEGRYREYWRELCEGWSGFTSDVVVVAEGGEGDNVTTSVRLPHSSFLAAHQRVNMAGLVEHMRSNLNADRYSPKKTMIVIRAELYELLWRNQGGELFCKARPSGWLGKTTLELLSMLESSGAIERERAGRLRQTWLRAAAVLFVQSAVAWRHCVEGAKDVELGLEGLRLTYMDGGARVDEKALICEEGPLRRQLEADQALVEALQREGVGRLAEEVCGGGQAALAAGVSCLEAVSAVVRAVGYEGDVGVALDEAGRWEVDRPHHQEGR